MFFIVLQMTCLWLNSFLLPIYGKQTYTESHETIHILSNTGKVILLLVFVFFTVSSRYPKAVDCRKNMGERKEIINLGGSLGWVEL